MDVWVHDWGFYFLLFGDKRCRVCRRYNSSWTIEDEGEAEPEAEIAVEVKVDK